MKHCSRCKTNKPTSEFWKNATAKDGLSYWCNLCSRRSPKYYRVCSQCKEIKHRVGFSKHKKTKDGLSPSCKECRNRQFRLNKHLIKSKSKSIELTPEQKQYAKTVLKRKKMDAKKKGVKCDFTLEWIEGKFRAGCAVTGVPFDFSGGRTPFAMEVDRIDPGGDYTKANSRFVCGIYNKAKWNFKDDDVRKMVLGLVTNNWEEYAHHLEKVGLIPKT